jgi:hypothetical protein
LAAWCLKVHGIPLAKLDDSSPGHGIGWHRLGIDGNFPAGILHGRRPGGEQWSSSAGKVCPGDSKIRGVVDDIIPRARDIANGDDMSDAQVQDIKDTVHAEADRVVKVIRSQAAIQAKRNARVLAEIDKLPDAATKRDVRQVVADELEKQQQEETP